MCEAETGAGVRLIPSALVFHPSDGPTLAHDLLYYNNTLATSVRESATAHCSLQLPVFFQDIIISNLVQIRFLSILQETPLT